MSGGKSEKRVEPRTRSVKMEGERKKRKREREGEGMRGGGVRGEEETILKVLKRKQTVNEFGVT